MRSILLGLAPLGVMLAIACVLTVARPLIPGPLARDRLVRIFLLGVALQCAHFVEEFTTGFYVEFPQLLGLAPWTPEFFVSFNLAWIAIWILAAVGIREGIRAALVPVWFLAIAMLVNMVAHPLMAFQAQGYFPGLFTSPLAGVVGLMLWPRVLAATQSAGPGLPGGAV